MRRLQGKVALVTGGAGGIGAAIARLFVHEGAKVTITDLQADAGRKFADEIGGDFLQQDVTLERQWADIMAQLQDSQGALHILVNNAGISTDIAAADTEHLPLAEWQKINRINVEGVFLGCRAAIPLLRRSGGGSIINMSSVAALRSNPDNPAYGASKSAVRHLTKSTAVYCARNGSNIRCNSVHPGLIYTPLLQRIIERVAKARNITVEQSMQDMQASVPTGKLLTPEDVASAVLFLASDEAQQITGAQLVVDGGLTAQ